MRYTLKYRKLGNTGLDVSVLSYGASSLGSVFKEINVAEGMKTVHTALDLGINYIDVSPYYGLTKAETVLGKALKEIPRDHYYLSTKAGRLAENEFNFSQKTIINSLEESLQRLGTDYVDILLLHDIEFGSYDQVINEGIPALQKLKAEGKIRFFGVSGLPLSIFDQVLEMADLDVILSYCHYSLNDTSLISRIPMLEKKQVGIINAAPLSMGLLSRRAVADWHPASEEVKQICQKAAEFCTDNGVDIAKLAIQFSVQHEQIPTTLVSTSSTQNMTRNVQWTTETIDHDLLQEVRTILKPIHNETWASGNEEWR